MFILGQQLLFIQFQEEFRNVIMDIADYADQDKEYELMLEIALTGDKEQQNFTVRSVY